MRTHHIVAPFSLFLFLFLFHPLVLIIYIFLFLKTGQVLERHQDTLIATHLQVVAYAIRFKLWVFFLRNNNDMINTSSIFYDATSIKQYPSQCHVCLFALLALFVLSLFIMATTQHNATHIFILDRSCSLF